MAEEPFQDKLPPDDGDGSTDVTIEEEISYSFLEYAMSVIVSRALPDVRDGLKPVHRRILFSALEAGLRPDRQYRKCAALVGDVMKKYHPHGDQAIYDAMARLAQDFSTRYLLIDGQGNFGSVDGDEPAAPRYTECRLSNLAMELLRNIDEETVDFVDNYDGYETEPSVLPARFPNLLVNGSSGIAVGMATNIPPHNLGEVIDATVELLRDPDSGRGRDQDSADRHEAHQGTGLPNGGVDRRPPRSNRRSDDRARLGQDARGLRGRGGPQGQPTHRRYGDPLPGQ